MKKTTIIASACCAVLAASACFTPAVCPPVIASAAVQEGQMKNKSYDYSWSYDDKTSVLEFKGTGALTSGDWKKSSSEVKKIIVGEGIDTLNYAVFSQLTCLESVELPEGLEEICAKAFYGCEKLKSITIPSTVKRIGNDAFMDCISLASVSVPDSVSVIEDYAFYNCGLKTVEFGKGVKEIKSRAFYGCNLLTSVNIPEGVEKIGEYAFYECNKLSAVKLPDSIKSISTTAFDNTSFVENAGNYKDGILYAGNVLLKAQKTGVPGKVTVKSGTVAIADYAFSQNWCISELVLPSTLRYIGSNTFLECINLKTVTFNKKLVGIGAYAFDGCKKLQAAVLPSTVESIGPAAFKNCKALKEISLPDTLTAIEYDTFKGCSAIASMKLPSALKSIGNDAFENVNAEIEIPDSVVCADKTVNPGKPVLDSADSRENHICYAGNHAQTTDSEELISETVKFRDGTVSISRNCLSGSTKIKAVIVPESVVYIGWNSLTCKNLKKVAIYNPDCVFYEDDINCVITKTATVYGYKGSTAEAYAEKHGVKFCDIACFEGHGGVITKACFDEDGTQEKICPVCGEVNASTTIPKINNITLSKENYICHNNECRPAVTVKDSKGNRLVENLDYTVTYKNNVNIGVARAEISLKGSRYSGTESIPFTINPANVYGLKTASRTDKTITLSWIPVDGAITYTIYKYTASGSLSKIGSTKNCTFTVEKLKADTEYTFGVIASKTVSGITYRSADYSKISTCTTVAAVKGAAATQTTSSVKLTWNKVAGAAGYRIYKYNSATKSYEKIGSTMNTYYSIKNLKSGTAFTYYVKAYKTADGKTLLSPTYTKIKTATKTAAPKAPTLTAGTKKLTAKWSKVTGATGYQVAYATSKSGTYKTVNTTKLTLTKTGLVSGKTYYVKVRTYKTVDGAKIYSAYSSTKTVRVK